MTKEELLIALQNPKTTISRCKRLRYVDADIAEEAARVLKLFFALRIFSGDDEGDNYA